MRRRSPEARPIIPMLSLPPSSKPGSVRMARRRVRPCRRFDSRKTMPTPSWPTSKPYRLRTGAAPFPSSAKQILPRQVSLGVEAAGFGGLAATLHLERRSLALLDFGGDHFGDALRRKVEAADFGRAGLEIMCAARRLFLFGGRGFGFVEGRNQRAEYGNFGRAARRHRGAQVGEQARLHFGGGILHHGGDLCLSRRCEPRG